MQPTPAEVLALLLRVLYQKGTLTAEEISYITIWSPDWEEIVYERDHDTQELVK
jgi:hypothetical protein